MSHFARKSLEKLTKKAQPQVDYPQQWRLQVNGELSNLPIRYTRRKGSIGLKWQNEQWVIYCPQTSTPKKVRSLLEMHQAELEKFIRRHSPKIQQISKQRQEAAAIDSEFQWLGQTRKIHLPIEQMEPQLIAEAQEYLEPKVQFYAAQMQLNPKQIKVKNYKSCWGNCYHQRGLVQFNWKLLQAPEWVVDYVIVHELAHLVHPNHSRLFWALVNHHYPKTPQAKSYLKLNGSSMMGLLRHE